MRYCIRPVVLAIMDIRAHPFSSPVDICFGTKPSLAAKSRPFGKSDTIGDGGHHRTRDERANAGHGHQISATLAPMCQLFDLVGNAFDSIIKAPPIGAEGPR